MVGSRLIVFSTIFMSSSSLSPAMMAQLMQMSVAPAAGSGSALPRSKLGAEYRRALVRKHEQAAVQFGMIAASGLSSIALSTPPLRAPSNTTPLDDTSAIVIKDMRVGKLHSSRHLLCRIIGPAVRLTSIALLIEDEDGNAMRLGVYNYVSSSTPLQQVQALFSLGTIWRILHPFLKEASDGDLVIRVDDPQLLQARDAAEWGQSQPGTQAPLAVAVASTAEECKEAGNAAYGRGEWTASIDQFTRGLSLQPNAALRLALLSNRAAAFLGAERFLDAEQDALLVLSEDATHQKAIYRLLLAIAGQGDWTRAKAEKDRMLATTLQHYSVSKDVRLLMADLDRAHEEATEGKFDLRMMWEQTKRLQAAQGKSSPSRPLHLPRHATFISPLVSFGVDVPGCGRGVVARAVLQAGALLCACPAVAIGASDERSFGLHVSTMRTLNTKSQQELVGEVMRKAIAHSDVKRRLSTLYAGSHAADQPSSAAFDIDRVTRIVAHNSFNADLLLPNDAPPAGVSLPRYAALLDEMRCSRRKKFDKCSGLWLEPSLFNHSCAPNCHKVLLADWMFVYALRDVASGEECTISYVPVDQSGKERRATLKQAWEFDCRCQRCQREESKTQYPTGQNMAKVPSLS